MEGKAIIGMIIGFFVAVLGILWFVAGYILYVSQGIGSGSLVMSLGYLLPITVILSFVGLGLSTAAWRNIKKNKNQKGSKYVTVAVILNFFGLAAPLLSGFFFPL